MPVNTYHLKTLENIVIIDIFEYYDQPCLFSCRNSFNQLFIALWIDRIANGDVWLYIPVTSDQLDSFRKQNDFHLIIYEPETDHAYKVTTNFSGGKDNIEVVSTSKINKQYLLNEKP